MAYLPPSPTPKNILGLNVSHSIYIFFLINYLVNMIDGTEDQCGLNMVLFNYSIIEYSILYSIYSIIPVMLYVFFYFNVSLISIVTSRKLIIVSK